MQAFNAILDDLEAALQDGAHDRRVAMLRRVTVLFLDSAQGLDAEQVEVFGDVISHLTRQLESKVLAELSAKLAPVDNAPQAVLRSLAHHDEISVAGPVLTQSKSISEGDLIEIARTKGQGHLGAISQRPQLAEKLTDVLVARGDNTVVETLTKNGGAVFSSAGLSTIAERARSHEGLAAALSNRVDLPPNLLKELMLKATEAVQERLKSVAPANADIRKVVSAAASQVMREVGQPRNFRRAEALIAEMQTKGQLNEQAVVDFAKAGHYEDMAVGLARLCAAPLDLILPLLQNPAPQGLMLACKASGLDWPTVEAVLQNRQSAGPLTTDDLEAARLDFEKLTSGTAQRVFRFWLVRGVAGRIG